MIKKIMKILIFFLLFFIIFCKLSKIFVHKYDNKRYFMDKYDFSRIYDIDKSSLDVVYLGGSHVMCGINPLFVFKKYGFSSYCLSAPAMNIDIAYFYINEILKKQKPKVLVLDVGILNSGYSEGNVRVALDYAKNSFDKLIAYYRFKEKNNKIKIVDYFNLIRYHSRYKELKIDDFKKLPNEREHTKGYYATAFDARKDFGQIISTPLLDWFYDNEISFNLGNYEKGRLDEIKKICENNNILLLLIKIPTYNWKIAMNREINLYAKENNIHFIDFHLLLKDIGFDESTMFDDIDMRDNNSKMRNSHLNYKGALLISDYIGKYLKEKEDLPDRRKEKNFNSWETDYLEMMEYYDTFVLHTTSNLNDYLSFLKGKRYTIICFSIAPDFLNGISEKTSSLFYELGLEIPSNKPGNYGFIGLIRGNKVEYSNLGLGRIEYQEKINNIKVNIISSPFDNDSSAKINNNKFQIISGRFMIIVLSEDLNKIYDIASFDTYNDNPSAFRVNVKDRYD